MEKSGTEKIFWGVKKNIFFKFFLQRVRYLPTKLLRNFPFRVPSFTHILVKNLIDRLLENFAL